MRPKLNKYIRCNTNKKYIVLHCQTHQLEDKLNNVVEQYGIANVDIGTISTTASPNGSYMSVLILTVWTDSSLR